MTTSTIPAETAMWDDFPRERTTPPSDSEINEKYTKRELRIVTETNREQLPNFVNALNRPGWIDLKPFYQRRQRWDPSRKSKLIESFIMNVPVPPIFLYESEFARYEVMDGQQRITAIWEFYENKFKLRGLEQWPELNGRIYSRLPSEIRKGLDRRSISSIVLLKESANTSDDEVLLRQQVFERLNTGGVELENQEIRHCIYHNNFDELLLELSRISQMREAWDLPLYSSEELTNPPAALLKNAHFSKMRDVEFILRCFALRHVNYYRGGMQSFLDNYMVRSRRFSNVDIEQLGDLFRKTIVLAEDIYGDLIFRPFIEKDQKWSGKPQIAYADATMVALSHLLPYANKIRARHKQILKNSKELSRRSPKGMFTGQGNTKQAVEDRLNIFQNMLINSIK